MSFENSISNLNIKKAVDLEQSIIEIGLALLGGGKPYEYIRQKKNKAKTGSVMRRSYEVLLTADSKRLMNMVDVFLDGVK